MVMSRHPQMMGGRRMMLTRRWRRQVRKIFLPDAILCTRASSRAAPPNSTRSKRRDAAAVVHVDVPLFSSDEWGGPRPARDSIYNDQAGSVEAQLGFARRGDGVVNLGRGIRIVDEVDPSAAARADRDRQLRAEASAAEQLADEQFIARQVATQFMAPSV
eukprot:489317-Prymnesium_polylepis.1